MHVHGFGCGRLNFGRELATLAPARQQQPHSATSLRLTRTNSAQSAGSPHSEQATRTRSIRTLVIVRRRAATQARQNGEGKAARGDRKVRRLSRHPRTVAARAGKVNPLDRAKRKPMSRTPPQKLHPQLPDVSTPRPSPSLRLAANFLPK